MLSKDMNSLFVLKAKIAELERRQQLSTLPMLTYNIGVQIDSLNKLLQECVNAVTYNRQ